MWPHWVVEMVIELLSHPTPPSCISANILTIAEALLPDMQVVHELPGLSWIRDARGLMTYLTKTMAAYQLAIVETYDQLFTDGTSRRHTPMQNVVIGWMSEQGFKTLVLNNAILATNETGEAVTLSIIRAFKEGSKMIEIWREVTKRMFPDRDDLLDRLPLPTDLTLSKLAKGSLMTDTCTTARKIRRLLVEAVTKAAKDSGMSDDGITIFEQDCWDHLRNIWFEAVQLQLSSTLNVVLAPDLEEIPSFLRVGTDIVTIMRAVVRAMDGPLSFRGISLPP